MSSELSSPDRKVIMAYQLSPGDSGTTSCPSKRAHGGTSTGTGVTSNPSMSPAKRQKKDVVAEKEVQDAVPQQGKFNAQGQPFAEEDGDSRCNKSEPLKATDGRGNAGDGAGSANVEAQGSLEIAGVVEPVSPQRRPRVSDTTGSANSEPGDCDVDNGSLLAADATATSEADGPPSDSSASGSEADGPSSDSSASGSIDSAQGLNVPASVSQRQKNDPELREKIHKVETDFWADSKSRDVYNEERLKLYTEEEMKEARIVWPRREVQSPAGYREEILEQVNYRCFDGGPSWDDVLYEFGCPFKEDNFGGDEEAAKKRLKDKIEQEFEDPEAKRAEYERWEKIRDVETKYYNNLISRTNYNKRRFALYTEGEREEKSIVWPNNESTVCYSPAGFRDAVFEEFARDEPDWQTRMDFHYPFVLSSEDTTGEEHLCELCVPLIEKHRDFLKVQKVRRKEVEAMQKAARKEEEAKRLLEMQEKEILAKKNERTCAECNRKFGSERALGQHAAAKHKR